MDNEREQSAKLRSTIEKSKMENSRNHHHQNLSMGDTSFEKIGRPRHISSHAAMSSAAASSASDDEDLEYIEEPSMDVAKDIEGVVEVTLGISKTTWIIIGASIVCFILLIIIISAGFLVKNSDSLSYVDQNYFANEEYEELYNEVETVVSEYKSEYGVTVDKYLIIAALTAYQDNEQYMDDTESDAYDSIEVQDENGNTKDISKMKAQIEILAKYQIKTSKSCSASSSSLREIASNDDSTHIFNFWTSAAAKEKNYDCSGSGKKYTLSTEQGSLDDENSGSVFYWNMIDEDFFAEYYPEYFDGLTKEQYENQAAHALDYIYMYAKALGQLECDDSGSLVSNYATADGTCRYVTVEPDANGNYAGTYELEEYVAGVIADEFSPSYMGVVTNDEQAIKENIKAFAIAIRSFTVVVTDNCTKPIANSSVRQNFRPTDDALIWEGVNETTGLVLYKDDSVVLGMYDSFMGNSESYCSGNLCTYEYQTLPSKTANPVSIPRTWLRYAAGGHGKGMSQWGALYLATTGKNYEEIVKYFYDDDAEIRKLENSGAITHGSSSSYCVRKGNITAGEGVCDGTSYYGGRSIGEDTLDHKMTLLTCTADQAELAFAEIAEACGPIPHAGSIRGLSAEVNAARSSTSFHYTGRAFDLNTQQGMKKIDGDNDVYFYVTHDDTSGNDNSHYYRLYCEVINDEADSDHIDNIAIIPVYWKNGKVVTDNRVKKEFLDVTAVFNKYGLYGIGPRSCMKDGNYMCTEWWHFQDTSGLVTGVTTFRTTLDQYFGIGKNYGGTPVNDHLNKKWNGGYYG